MEFNAKFKDFPDTTWKKIEAAVEQVLKTQKRPIAAFDADGTLWDTDLGETFFDFLIENKKVKLPVDPWSHYEALKKQHPPTAYLWLAQICENQSLETIREWTEAAVQILHPVPFFEAQKKLIDYFLSKNIQIYIITASVKWSVEPGAKLLGLTADNVIGVETEILNGAISNKQKGAITYREGKVEALLAHTNGQKPFFASGNSEGDQELLASATHLSLAVSAAHQDDKLYRSEDKLQKLAEKSGWLSHKF